MILLVTRNESIQYSSFSVTALFWLWVMVDEEPVLGMLDVMPIYLRATCIHVLTFIHIEGQFGLSALPTGMFLVGGRKPTWSWEEYVKPYIQQGPWS